MNTNAKRNLLSLPVALGAGLGLLLARPAVAGTVYVDAGCTNATWPYTNWDTAAVTIQDAVDAANPGDTLLVTNGVYATGGRTVNGYLPTNRVAVTKPLSVQSINGPAVTIIQGYQVPGTTNGDSAVRCVYLTNNATLIGFTLTKGATRNKLQVVNNYEDYGGGAWAASPTAVISNCVFYENSAYWSGGGAYNSTLINCTFTNNSATVSFYSSGSGGGAKACILNGCTLVRNTAYWGGGAESCSLSNCALSGNSADGEGGGASYCMLTNCTIVGNISYYGGGAANSTLTSCTLIDNISANGYGGGADSSVLYTCVLYGNSAGVGGGCWRASVYNCSFSNNVAGWGGGVSDCTLVDCTLNDNRATNYGGAAHFASLTDCILSSNSSALGGGAHSTTLNDCVLTSNTASNGGGAYSGTLNNCTLSSNSAYCGAGAYSGTLSNCTVMNNLATNSGGGACAGTLLNCRLASNLAYNTGGGGLSNSLINCQLSSNMANFGGGAGSCSLSNCILSDNSATENGGGAIGSTLNNCILLGNTASNLGGGSYQSTLNNCMLNSNTALFGGGAFIGTIRNCTIARNSAQAAGGGAGGSSINPATLRNCILYSNSAPYDPNYSSDDSTVGLNYCCTTPIPTNGVGNFPNVPLFVDMTRGDFHLQSNSPCINAGNNAYVTTSTDVDGNPRISGGTVDIGAYEFQNPPSVLSYVWAQQYGLPTDGTADYADPDGDGFNNWEEWIAGTNPTNALSALQMLLPSNAVSGVTVSWQSVNTRKYFLQRATDFGVQPPFSTLQSNIVGQAGTTSYADTNPIGPGPFFYRVGVQQ